MRLGERPFIVLALRDGAGTISHPASFGLSDGGRFTQISTQARTAPLTIVEIDGPRVRFSVLRAGDPSESDTYDLTVVDEDRATLTPIGLPFDAAWTLTRHTGDDLPRVATDWDAKAAYAAAAGPAVTVSNAEMAAIYDEDQQVRQKAPTANTPAEWEAMARGDASRRARTRMLLEAGQLHTGEDFRKAAFLFQHGIEPDDYLLAHTLALVAIAKGDASATWIGAATLDRYLQAIGQPQIYGTQYVMPGSGPATQDPYDRELISDALRRELGVPALASQATQLEELRKAASGSPN
jgi:hypothetical protein